MKIALRIQRGRISSPYMDNLVAAWNALRVQFGAKEKYLLREVLGSVGYSHIIPNFSGRSPFHHPPPKQNQSVKTSRTPRPCGCVPVGPKKVKQLPVFTWRFRSVFTRHPAKKQVQKRAGSTKVLILPNEF